MKKILLIRHAKSDWNLPGLRDFDRPLNERGKRDVPMMAARLSEKNILPDLIVSSPAVRAATTAKGFADALGLGPERFKWVEQLYLPEPDAFLQAIHALPSSVQTVCIFSHNSGITLFANRFSGVTIDNIPTCGIVAARADISSWENFEERKAQYWFADFPKRPSSF